MSNEQQIKRLAELEAIFQLAEDKAALYKRECHKARQQLEGVSTSSNARKGKDYSKSIAEAVTRRNSKIHAKA